jgi:hypothetical protein
VAEEEVTVISTLLGVMCVLMMMLRDMLSTVDGAGNAPQTAA